MNYLLSTYNVLTIRNFKIMLQARLEAKLIGIKEKKAKEAAENPEAAKKATDKKGKGKKKK